MEGNKQIVIRSEQINSSFSQENPYVYSTRSQKVVAISITNMATSPYNLLIGFNEIPSTKIYLQPGESLPLGPYRDGDFINDNLFQFGFETADDTNRAVIVVSTEGEKAIC